MSGGIALESETVVTFVHGTFARRSKWCMPGAAMWTRVAEQVPCSRIHRFEWSGENSHTARVVAGAALAEHVLAVASAQPRARHVLVCHSHGGNVALYAMRDQMVERNVGGVVFLATPFVDVAARPPLGLLPRLAPWSLEIAALTVAAFALVSRGLRADLAAPVLFFVFCAYPFFLMKRESWKCDRRERALRRLGCEVDESLRRVTEAAAADREWGERLHACLQPSAPDSERTLILRTRGDEASLALGASQLAAFTARISSAGAERLVYGPLSVVAARLSLSTNAAENAFVALAFLVVASFGFLGDVLADPLAPPLSATSSVAIVFFLATAGLWACGLLVVALASTVARFAQLAFGLDGFIWARSVSVFAEPCPRGSYVVEQLVSERTADGRPGAELGLAHSRITEDPVVIRRVIDFVRRLSSAAAPDHSPP